jgi:hypothetical protein
MTLVHGNFESHQEPGHLFYFILYAGSFCEDVTSLLILKYSTLLVKLIQFLILTIFFSGIKMK